VKRVFKYLKHLQGFIIWYKPEKGDLIKYLDADFAVNEDRQSMIRYIYILNDVTVTWAARK
jgi:hypothetical protein